MARTRRQTENKGGNSWWELVEELCWTLGTTDCAEQSKPSWELGSEIPRRAEVKCGDCWSKAKKQNAQKLELKSLSRVKGRQMVMPADMLLHERPSLSWIPATLNINS